MGPRRFALLAGAALFACAAPAEEKAVREPARQRRGDEIVVCGTRVRVGAPVVLWDEPGGYDAYATGVIGDRPESVDARDGRRYHPGRTVREGGRVSEVLVSPDSVDPVELAGVVDLIVLHYDACGTSEGCFQVLHHLRGLSVHFMLDLDGTIYQTLDLRERAWHAGEYNTRSVGIEIAGVGAYPPDDDARLGEWYVEEPGGTRLVLPDRLGDGGLRRPYLALRPVRAGRVRGRIQGTDLVQYDFTPQQYDSLVKLSAALCRTLPRIRPEAPRDASGEVRADVLAPDEAAAFHGIAGHYHLSAQKVDPGPAFDWVGFLARVEARLSAPLR